MLLDIDYLEREANHLLCGDYGEDIYLQAKRVLKSRMNKVAWIKFKEWLKLYLTFNLVNKLEKFIYLYLVNEQEKANKGFLN